MKKLLFYAFGIIAMMACVNADIEENKAYNDLSGIPAMVKAMIDDEHSRVQLNEEVKTVWTKGDLVSVFYKNSDNNKFSYVGETGATDGTLKRETEINSGVATDKIVAVYPYDANCTLDVSDEVVNMTIPSVQYYVDGSYGVGSSPMSYVGGSDNFYFKSLCGWLRVSLSGVKSVDRITLKGNNNEQLNGGAQLHYLDNELVLTSSSASSTKQLSLECKNPVALSSGKATEFYFAVVPQTFSEGVTIEVSFTDGTSFTKSTSKQVTIERNHIQPMKTLDTIVEMSDVANMPLISIYPEIIYDNNNDDIVVLVNATDTAMANYTGDMYAHTGLMTQNSTSLSDWKYVKADWNENKEECKLVNCGNNIWRFVIRGGVRSFYGVSNGDSVEGVLFVFRSADGKKEIKDNGSDILVQVYNAESMYTQLITTTPRVVDEDTLEDVIVTINTAGTVMDGYSGDIYAHTGVLTQKSTKVSDWKYVKANWNVNIESCKLKNVGDNLWQLTIKGGPRAFYGVASSDSIEYLAFVFRSPDGSVELKDGGEDILVYVKNDIKRRPIGAEYGVTVSGTSATFVLFAPGKQNVRLLGDFNNYNTSSTASKMNKDGDYFWLTVDNLSYGREYGYQYLVDGVRVGDPYCEKILDPWNDQWISSSTYPNLKSYPDGASDVVSVFELMPKEYNWEVASFKRPAKNSLAIYEMHIRDFTSEGTIKAAMAKLDYLQTLGINAIELMPIQEFDGNDSWGYNPCFPFAADKSYGTKDDYKRFIDECHKRGIAVILDIVTNHATGLFPYAKMWWDSGANNTTDANPFFNRVARHPYNVYHDFNHEYGPTRDYFKRMLKHWMKEYKVDGFRFDLSKGLTQKNSGDNVGTWNGYDSSRIAIIKDYADAIRSVSNDAYIILEHFADSYEENELASYRDIMLWNNQTHGFYQTVMGWDSESDFSGDAASGRVSYIESHDEERVAYKAVTWGQGWLNSNWSRLSKQLQGAYALHFLAPYPKMMWQFGELGYDVSIEYNDRTGKKPVYWNYYDDTNRKALYNAMSKIISWRTDHEKMYSYEGVTYTYEVGDDDFGGKHLIYSTSNGSVIAVSNFSNNHVSFDITVPRSGTWRNLMTGTYVNLESKYTVSLSGGDYIVLVKD